MRKTILLLLIAAFCASSCKDTFMFDKMYEDEGVFDLKVRIDNPTNITSSGAKISVTILTDEPLIGRGIAITTELSPPKNNLLRKRILHQQGK